MCELEPCCPLSYETGLAADNKDDKESLTTCDMSIAVHSLHQLFHTEGETSTGFACLVLSWRTLTVTGAASGL